MAVITFKGTPVPTVGDLPAKGQKAPNFSGTRNDLTDVELKDFLGKKIILNIFPSLDTPVCAASLRKFNSLASESDITVLCVSKDLPFAQSRFCSVEGLMNVIALSEFRHPEFGTTYGVTIADGPLKGLLSRAVLTLDEQGIIQYTEQVPEITNEPNYEAALATLR